MRRLIVLQLMFLVFQLALAQDGKQLGIAWKYQTDGSIRSGIIEDGQSIYFGNSSGQFICLNTAGQKRWETQLNGAIVSSPAIHDDHLFVTVRDQAIYALDKNNGSIKWKFEFSVPDYPPIGGWKYFGAGPLIWKDKLFAGTGNGTLYALDQETGKEVWSYKTGGPIRAAACTDGRYLYQPSNDGIVHVLDMSGRLIWQFKTDGAGLDQSNQGQVKKGIYNQPSLMNGLLIFGSRDGNTYAVDVNTRKEKWRFTYGPTWAMSNAVDQEYAYIGWSTNNKVTAINLLSGQMVWDKTFGAHNYAKGLIDQTSIMFGSADGHLYQLDKKTGEQIGSVEVGSEIYASPIRVGNLTIFGADNGVLFAAKEMRSPQKVVYLPGQIQGNAQYLVVDQKVAPYLVKRGFEQMDSVQLNRFIQDRIKDREPSVIVFALPLIPGPIMGQDPSKGLMRQYLETGGKVVWFGDLPNYYEPDENDQFKRDPGPGITLLGTDFKNANESGNYFSQATQVGRNWGLPSGFKTTCAIIAPQADILPLAYDEFNRISAWVKVFCPKPGSGFVSCRTWGWNLPIKDQDLEIIYNLATYGLE
jgi:outer membrane protein assembly factor BamB